VVSVVALVVVSAAALVGEVQVAQQEAAKVVEEQPEMAGVPKRRVGAKVVPQLGLDSSSEDLGQDQAV